MFTPVDERLVLEDRTQRLEIYHVLAHSHMANAVFAYLPAARIMMEGDLGDAEWTWHWWASALAANIKAYGIDPRLNVAVHGPNGGLSIEQTLANNQQADGSRAEVLRGAAGGGCSGVRMPGAVRRIRGRAAVGPIVPSLYWALRFLPGCTADVPIHCLAGSGDDKHTAAGL